MSGEGYSESELLSDSFFLRVTTVSAVILCSQLMAGKERGYEKQETRVFPTGLIK